MLDIKMDENNTPIIDEGNSNTFGSKEVQSFPNIILEHYRKCITEISKEIVEGGLKKIFLNGEIISIFVPNQIEIIINCVKALSIALIPFVEDCKDEELKKRIQNKSDILDAELPEIILKPQKKAIKNNEGELISSRNEKENEYYNRIGKHKIKMENEKIKAAKILLSDLTLLMKENGFFKEGSGGL